MLFTKLCRYSEKAMDCTEMDRDRTEMDKDRLELLLTREKTTTRGLVKKRSGINKRMKDLSRTLAVTDAEISQCVEKIALLEEQIQQTPSQE